MADGDSGRSFRHARTFRFSPGAVLNLAAWCVLALLILVALLAVNRLGFVGLTLLGAATWLVCSLARLDQDAPTWGAEVFGARLRRPASPEARAAMLAEREKLLSPLTFYGRCGIVLTVIGGLGMWWTLT